MKIVSAASAFPKRYYPQTAEEVGRNAICPAIAKAGIIAGSDYDLPGAEIVATRSTFYPHTHDVTGGDTSETGFRSALSPDVPKVARERLAADIRGFLADHGLSRSDIGSWIIHTGGPKVLAAVPEALGVDRRVLAAMGLGFCCR
jgi:alkylresorcinol/alkylpyrone synthase